VTRNVVITALVAVLMGGFVLAYLALRPPQAQQQMGAADSASQTGMDETAQGGDMQGDGMGEMAAEDVPRVPPVKAYYEGEEVFFIHTEVSDKKTSDLLVDMMGSPVPVVPELKEVPEEALSRVYVFTNGVKGKGPLGFQPDVFDSVPGDENYSPLRRLYLVTWKNEGEARELKTLGGVQEAEQNGEVTIEKQDVVINEPFLKWPGGQR
jgi:hypothetical protein